MAAPTTPIASTYSISELQHFVRQLELLKADVDRKVERKQMELRNLLQRTVHDGLGVGNHHRQVMVSRMKGDSRRGTYPQSMYDVADAAESNGALNTMPAAHFTRNNRTVDPTVSGAAEPFGGNRDMEGNTANFTATNVEGKKRVQFYVSSPARKKLRNDGEEESVLCQLTVPARAVHHSSSSSAAFGGGGGGSKSFPRSTSRSIPPMEKRTAASLDKNAYIQLLASVEESRSVSRISLSVGPRVEKRGNDDIDNSEQNFQRSIYPKEDGEVSAERALSTTRAPHRLRVINPLIPTRSLSLSTTRTALCDGHVNVKEEGNEPLTREKRNATSIIEECHVDTQCAGQKAFQIMIPSPPRNNSSNIPKVNAILENNNKSDISGNNMRGSGDSSEGVPFHISCIDLIAAEGGRKPSTSAIASSQTLSTPHHHSSESADISDPSPQQSFSSALHACKSSYSTINTTTNMVSEESRGSLQTLTAAVAPTVRSSDERRRSVAFTEELPSVIPAPSAASSSDSESLLSLSPLSLTSNTPSPLSMRASDPILWDISSSSSQQQQERLQTIESVSHNNENRNKNNNNSNNGNAKHRLSSQGSPYPTELALLQHRSSASSLQNSSDVILRAALLSFNSSRTTVEDNAPGVEEVEEDFSFSSDSSCYKNTQSSCGDTTSSSTRKKRQRQPQRSRVQKRKRENDSQQEEELECGLPKADNHSSVRIQRNTLSVRRSESTRSSRGSTNACDASDTCSKPFAALLDRCPRSKKFTGLGHLPVSGKATFTLPRSTESIPLNLIAKENEDAFTPFEAATRVWLRQWNRRQN